MTSYILFIQVRILSKFLTPRRNVLKLKMTKQYMIFHGENNFFLEVVPLKLLIGRRSCIMTINDCLEHQPFPKPLKL